MGIFKKKEERAEEINAGGSNNNLGLESLLGLIEIDKKRALQIPSVSGAIEKIANTISKLPIKLYKKEDGKVEEVENDRRTFLLNVDTGDTLSAADFWKALIEDYYLGKGAYFYINKAKGDYKSFNYVDESKIQIIGNTDPIFKDFDILVNGQRFFPFEFVKILRKTKDGAKSSSITDENKTILSVVYESLLFEHKLVKKGGNKRGFFKSPRKLSGPALQELKDSIENLYKGERSSVLNDGVDFKETSATSVELQLNENKITNGDEIFKIFNFPASVVKGGASEEDKKIFTEAVIGVLTTIEAALDKDLLREEEKGSFYFAFDTTELTRGNLKERFEAYSIAIEKNIMQVDEIREREDLEPYGFNYIKLGLEDVLYDPKTKEIYVPNTGQTAKLNAKGGE